ncbi:MAG: glycerol-3-phosphate 1-O-acyltransferase PlsY [Clostridia bacterium]|nr:glycerol-3-phosphate 1-O-acyltransferase PlsY [Clostridia bacterium]
MNFFTLSAGTDTFLVKETLIMLAAVLICAAIGYFLGSINTAILYSKLRYKKDIRNFGSGNAGMTNMLRTFGKVAAVITLVCDLLKTVVAVLLAQLLANGFGYLCVSLNTEEFASLCAYTAALFAVTGHCFPIYYKMRGGKGVAAVAAACAVTSPVTFLCLLLIFVITVAGTKYVSLGSILCMLLYPVFLSSIEGLGISNIFAILIAALVIWRHRENITRLREGKENKISFKGKKNGGDGKADK